MGKGALYSIVTSIGLCVCANTAAPACGAEPMPLTRDEAQAAVRDGNIVLQGKVIETYERCVSLTFGSSRAQVCYFDAKIDVIDGLGSELKDTILVKDIAVWVPGMCNRIPRRGSEEYFILPIQHLDKISRLAR